MLWHTITQRRRDLCEENGAHLRPGRTSRGPTLAVGGTDGRDAVGGTDEIGLLKNTAYCIWSDNRSFSNTIDIGKNPSDQM